ncbi:hypothetical protein MCP1_10178 [Candidatus Terasakiella magnetica]|nr:hypothetical protein MCP1_10178 [Candidatus Terasakiella magnetica]
MPNLAVAPGFDRRMATRFDGRGLMANIGGILMDLSDISIGGARIARLIDPPKTPVLITLYPREGNRLILNASVSVTGTVVHADQTCLRVRFDTTTFALSKLIVQHAARKLGVMPHTVK